jgi:hypothetical protein
MKASYDTTISVPRGEGIFNRMKANMHSTSHAAVNGLFNACMKELLDAIKRMVQDLSGRIDMLKESISNSLSSVYSILWEDLSAGRIVDPVHQQKVLAYRVACLPILNKLRKRQDQVMQVLSIEPPVLDLEIAAVETWEQTNERKMQEAIANGGFVDVDDGELDNDGNGKNNSNVKLENGSKQRRIKNETVQRGSTNDTKGTATRDPLDDSDDDDDDIIEGFYVYAKPGSIGLIVRRDDKYPDGFIVTNVPSNSQLAGKVIVGDVLTTLDSRRMKSLSVVEFENLCNAPPCDEPLHKIYIERTTKNKSNESISNERQTRKSVQLHV